MSATRTQGSGTARDAGKRDTRERPVFMISPGAMALGGVIWGSAAAIGGASYTLLGAAVLFLTSLLLARRLSINVTSSDFLPESIERGGEFQSRRPCWQPECAEKDLTDARREYGTTERSADFHRTCLRFRHGSLSRLPKPQERDQLRVLTLFPTNNLTADFEVTVNRVSSHGFPESVV